MNGGRVSLVMGRTHKYKYIAWLDLANRRTEVKV